MWALQVPPLAPISLALDTPTSRDFNSNFVRSREQLDDSRWSRKGADITQIRPVIQV
jgi:hypothetical protein